MMQPAYQFSQMGFITVSFTAAKRNAGNPFASFPFSHKMLGLIALSLFLILISVYAIQINTVSGANIRFEKLKEESAALEEEYTLLSSRVRSLLSADSLEQASQALAMEKGEARFLEETKPIFVAK